MGVVLGAVYYLLVPRLVAETAYIGVGALAVLAILAGIRLHRPARALPWLLVAAAIGLFTAGDLCWSILALAGEETSPSVADIAYVLGYPALTLAFLRITGVRASGGDRSGLLDGLIMAIAVALIGYVWLLRPLLESPGDPLAVAIGMAYPLGDLAIIGAGIGLLATPGRRSVSLLLLLAGMGMQCLGDILYAEQVAIDAFVEHGPIDAAWLASYVLFASAALVPSMRQVAVPHPVAIAWLPPVRLAFLAGAILTGPVLMLWHADADVPVLVGGWTALALMVVLRLALSMRSLASDNAARRTLDAELSHRATHDPLTGLANRRAFLERLERALGELAAAPAGTPVTVLFLDLDDFKTINDTLGHAAGDALLIAVAQRMRGHLRQADTAARMGGDEFGIILRADEAVAIRVGQRILDGFREPLEIEGRSIGAQGSIGVAQARPGVTIEDLLADADAAMYEAKSHGKNQVFGFRPELRDDVARRMRFEHELREAIAGDGLTLDYQPIFDLASGRPVGVEALVRWPHPTRGTLPPSMFVPFAESTGHGRALGVWVLEHACEQLAAWRRTLDPDLWLTVNLAPRQLAGSDLMAIVWGATQRVGLPMSALVVDVTEGALLLDAPEVAGNLTALRALGTRVAIDDFGAGLSSLGSLGNLPVNILKIDRALVEAARRDDHKALAGVVVDLGDSLELETIAEGIETAEQHAALMALGCRLGQGYHLAPPASPEAFEALWVPSGPGAAPIEVAVLAQAITLGGLPLDPGAGGRPRRSGRRTARGEWARATPVGDEAAGLA